MTQQTVKTGGIAGDILLSYIERIERLEEEKRDLGKDVREVYSEAKASGFEPAIMRKIVALRRLDAQERTEQEELIDLYARAIGMRPQLDMFEGATVTVHNAPPAEPDDDGMDIPEFLRREAPEAA